MFDVCRQTLKIQGCLGTQNLKIPRNTLLLPVILLNNIF